MGSNMQRQAVPCLRTAAPLVGTGMESHVARDSGSTVVALRDGIVEQVDGARIVVKPVTNRQDGRDDNRGILGAKPDIYNLVKFQRSNQNTALNQKPIVRVGDRVKRGDVIADGAATERGELALGQNVVVAFMPWQGYNFEDSILVSERIVREDVYTSIHIEEFECVARDTKLGKEEITCDIPNVGEEALANLDEAGVVRIGAEVKAGDILVGKITPKGETQLSPEEKLLRAIFGEKAGDVRDTSLRLPPGVSGIIIDARVFARKSVEKDTRAQQIEDAEREKLIQDHRDNVSIVSDGYYNRMKEILGGKITAANLNDDSGRTLVPAGTALSDLLLVDVPRKYWGTFSMTTAEDTEIVEALARRLEKDLDEIETIYREKIAKLTKGDELPPGVIKMVKVYVAIKRKMQVGDKMAGRHGNKGVISRILPVEDLPYLEDGTQVDLVLNPLGVPSRMNVGQILEVHLGWAAYELGQQIDRYMQTRYSPDILRAQLKKIYETKEAQRFIDQLNDEDVARFADKLRRGVHMATPVFDGALETEVKTTLQKAGLPRVRSGHPLRRSYRRSLRGERHRRHHVHAQAAPPRGRQDPRAQHRAVLAGHPAAPRRQGPVRRPAPRRDGGLGARGLRRRLRAAGAAHRQVRRRRRTHADVRVHRQGPAHHAGRRPRVLQRAPQGAAGPVPEHRAGRRERGDRRRHQHRPRPNVGGRVTIRRTASN